jgi:hypothetical protein
MASAKGTPSHINWSGDKSILFKAAAGELAKLSGS